MESFTSSIMFGGNLFLDQHVQIDNKNIVYEKETMIFGFTSNVTTIPKKYVRKIEVENNILGCNINIYYCYPFKSYDEIVTAHGFSKNDSERIKQLLL